MEIVFGEPEKFKAVGWDDKRQETWLVAAWPFGVPSETRYFNVDPKQWAESSRYREIIKTAVRERMGGQRELPHL